MKLENVASKGYLKERMQFGNGLRRALAVLLVGAALLCSAPVSFGADVQTQGSAPIRADSAVSLTRTQVDFTLPIFIEYGRAFAGVELAIQCGTGVTIESVDYSVAQYSEAGPEEARGLVWFTAFSGANSFTGGLTATVYMHYAGTENTSIVIDHAAFHTAAGGAFQTENVPLRKVIAISREGADNPPLPLDPPDPSVKPGGGNPPSGNAARGNSSVNSNPVNTVSTSAGGGNADNGSDATAERGMGNLIEQTTSGEVGDNTAPIPSSEVPRAGGNENTLIPGDDAAKLNMALLVLAAVCLVAVLTLGFLLIKRKREEGREETDGQTTKEVL
ncbi:MAG: hypothetical protein LBO81_03490 [Clostridiales Family XIII bacterium]|jgi:hypothetical protein|nr:hypothetical protein [Clostridiales Family XIII bacterium]